MAAQSPNRGRRHRHRLPGRAGGGMRRQRIIRRFRRLTECGKVAKRPVGGRLLGVHALHRVPNFADPTTDSPGPVFNITKVGISDAALHTHHFLAVLNECGRLVGNNPSTDVIRVTP
jgi:hypothetical protein